MTSFALVIVSIAEGHSVITTLASRYCMPSIHTQRLSNHKPLDCHTCVVVRLSSLLPSDDIDMLIGVRIFALAPSDVVNGVHVIAFGYSLRPSDRQTFCTLGCAPCMHCLHYHTHFTLTKELQVQT